ncbi:MAG: hypothetical protein LQ346_004905 [Caloplaca aetnensis]|nr:MAG: hypothetical protein LQ346_004905 [Caloplaca aetnensis]
MAADEDRPLDERKPTLTTIPPEIRQIIYRYTYSGITNVDLESEGYDSIGCKSGYASAILRVCKLFYTEAQPIFSGQCLYHVRYDERYAVSTYHGCFHFMKRSLAPVRSYISSFTIDVYSQGSTAHRPGPPNPTPPFGFDLYMRRSHLVDVPLLPFFCSSYFPVLAEVILHCQHLYKIEESHDEQPAASEKDFVVTVKPRYVNDIPILSFGGEQSARFAFNNDECIVKIVQSDIVELSPFSACSESYARSEGFIAFDDYYMQWS